MNGILRYALLPACYFPALLYALCEGSYWPLVYVLVSEGLYIVVDATTPPLRTGVSARWRRYLDALLYLQVPASVVLLAVLALKLRDSDGALVRALPLSVQALLDTYLPSARSALEAALASLAVGFHLSTNTVVAHELMHRRDRLPRALSRLLLVMVGDAQFQEAHLYGHHANVGTAKDPATARYGENLYAFVVRSTIGQFREAHAHERRRLRNTAPLRRLLENRVLRGNVASLMLLVGSVVVLGPTSALGLLGVMLMAKLLLEAINYIQHYGLVRDPRERTLPKHSWDCSSRLSTMVLFNLTRHADHHAHPSKPFWELAIMDDSPLLPQGYMATLYLAFVPPLWFRYSEPLLRAWRAQSEATPPRASAA